MKTGVALEDDEPIATRWDLPVKYDLNQSNALPPIPNRWCSVFSNRSRFIVSNAALVSSRTSITQGPEYRFGTMSC